MIFQSQATGIMIVISSPDKSSKELYGKLANMYRDYERIFPLALPYESDKKNKFWVEVQRIFEDSKDTFSNKNELLYTLHNDSPHSGYLYQQLPHNLREVATFLTTHFDDILECCIHTFPRTQISDQSLLSLRDYFSMECKMDTKTLQDAPKILSEFFEKRKKNDDETKLDTSTIMKMLLPAQYHDYIKLIDPTLNSTKCIRDLLRSSILLEIEPLQTLIALSIAIDFHTKPPDTFRNKYDIPKDRGNGIKNILEQISTHQEWDKLVVKK
jgi:hypothetical protein